MLAVPCYLSLMFERIPPVRRFDEALAATAQDDLHIRRRSTPFVVGDANDSAERRADAAADRGLSVLRAGTSRLPNSASAPVGTGSRIQRSATGSTIGRAGGEVDTSTARELDGAIGRGRRFAPDVQDRIRRATGHDVGDVNLHTDTRADRLARSMQANAFTVDRDVFFASGQFRPDTDDGMHTILHESAHLAEGARGVQRQVIQRRMSTRPEDLDGSFKHHTGVRGITKSMSSDEIPKIRNALKRYHATKPGSPRELEELQILLKLGDEWLRKHAKVQSSSDQAGMELIDSIRTQAGMEYGKIQAEAVYMAAGKAGGATQKGPGALANLTNHHAFTDSTLYEDRTKSAANKRNEYSGGKHQEADERRAQLAGELRAPNAEQDKRLTEAMETLTPAEYAALHTYTGGDYTYINPNVGGWGKGKMDTSVGPIKLPNGQFLKKQDGTDWSHTGANDAVGTDGRTGKQNRERYEEAGLHAGLTMQAFAKLPLWTGTTFRGMAMSTDFLGLLSKSSYQAHDFWSTSESVTVSKGFVSLAAGMNPDATKAAICRITVTNGRDVSRISEAPKELEILLPPGSTYKIAKPTKLVRGRDDAMIQQEFGSEVFAKAQLTEFYVVRLIQSTNKKVFESAEAKSAGPKDVYPWDLMGGRRMLYH